MAVEQSLDEVTLSMMAPEAFDLLDEALAAETGEVQLSLIRRLNAEIAKRYDDVAQALTEQFFTSDADIPGYLRFAASPLVGPSSHIEGVADSDLTVLERLGESGYHRKMHGSVLIEEHENKTAKPSDVRALVPKRHDGIDFLASAGTQVQSVLGGKIVEFQKGFGISESGFDYSDSASGKYGTYVVVEHEMPDGHKIRTKYAHLSGLSEELEKVLSAYADRTPIMLDPKDQVKVSKGKILGFAGMTGNAADEHPLYCHLHFEIHDVDSGKLIKPEDIYRIKLLDEAAYNQQKGKGKLLFIPSKKYDQAA